MKVYNFYDTMNRIANYKLDYENSDAKGDEEGKKKAAEAAKPLYESLRSAGFSNYADDLSKSNSQQAFNLTKKAGKYNNTPFREYMYNKGQSMGLDKSKIDSMIKFDNDTGQIYFGGKNIGNPTAIVDGVSYYSDTSVLDKAFDNAMNTLGVEVPYDKKAQMGNSELIDRRIKNDDYLRELNEGVLKELDKSPFEGETADAVYNRYGVDGDKASRNALADGASANSGNIDSFAQANANRWKAYYKSLADQSLLNYYDARTGKYQNNLNYYSEASKGNLNELREDVKNSEAMAQASKRNDFYIESEKAKLTGVQPESWYPENPFIKNGVPVEMDYQEKIDAITEQLKDPTLSSDERARMEDELWNLRDAQNKKIDLYPELYGKYRSKSSVPGPRFTTEEKQRNFENDQTATNNFYNNAVISSAITGNVDNGVGNPYFANGKVKPQLAGYYTYQIISIDNQLKDPGITQDKKDSLEAQRAYLYEAARANGESLSGISPSAPRKSYTNMNDELSRASAERISMAGIDSSNHATDVQAETEKYKVDKNSEDIKYQVDNQNNTKTKPILTASQVSKAISDGIMTQDVIDAYNYYYGTNHTLDNPPTVSKSDSDSAPLSDKEVKEWVNWLNKDISEKYGDDFKAIKESGKDKYERGNVDADYIIVQVINSTDLTQEQKDYLLYDKFGITEDQVNAVLKDDHYR